MRWSFTFLAALGLTGALVTAAGCGVRSQTSVSGSDAASQQASGTDAPVTPATTSGSVPGDANSTGQGGSAGGSGGNVGSAGDVCVGTGVPRICVAAGSQGHCTAQAAGAGSVAASCDLVDGDSLCVYTSGGSNCSDIQATTHCDVSVAGTNVNRNCAAGASPPSGGGSTADVCVGSGLPRICISAGGHGTCTRTQTGGSGLSASCNLLAGDVLCIYRTGGSNNCSSYSGPAHCDINVDGGNINRNCN